MNNTIIVTGGAGYIGSHTILEILEKTDFKVISIDNFSNSSAETYDRIKLISGKAIEQHNFDLCDVRKTEDFFEKTQNILGVIHFAAFKSVPESVENPSKYYRNNILSLLNLLDCCTKFNIPNFIFSSSCSVYGNTNTLPVNEETPIGKAESPYGYTKQVGEELLKDYANAYPELQLVALRYFNPVGAHISGKNGELPINRPNNLVPIITATAVGKIKQMTVFGNDYTTRDGTCIRDYVHVTDIANAHLKALNYLAAKKNTPNFSIFNLGTGNGVSVLEAIHAFEKISGLRLNYTIGAKRSGDVGAIFSDPTKSKKDLNWEPMLTLEKMMESAWKWEQYLQKKN